VKRKDLKFESDKNLYGLQYVELFLPNRKGWQKRLDKGVIETDLRSESDCHIRAKIPQAH
jgi:hypothetical protein